MAAVSVTLKLSPDEHRLVIDAVGKAVTMYEQALNDRGPEQLSQEEKRDVRGKIHDLKRLKEQI
jgi:hypothetical protein